MVTRVITLNVNGLRAAEKKGLMSWLSSQNPDFVCFQELKAQFRDLSNQHLNLKIGSNELKSVLHCSKKPGYSGVSILSKFQPTNVFTGIGDEQFDFEGRVIRGDYDNLLPEFPKLSIISLYLPSGSSSEIRQNAKFRFLDCLEGALKKWMKENLQFKREFILCGDWNIAHKEIDLKNWRNNKKNSGFLPEERFWISKVFEAGWIDVFRSIEPNTEQYTWWSQRGRAREKNVGWRIDYQVSTPKIASKVISARVEMKEKFSDHAPLIIDYG
tara:strand:+ start:1381 stop:2193 length:813 start_codon:yes stop_codon:yes gene_type:complete